jgi:RimJ/RimL family protein N-acetyltransferase
MKVLTPLIGAHAKYMYALVKDTGVTDQLLWDGPTDLASYEQGLIQREAQVRDGSLHMFTIIDPATKVPCGTADIREEDDEWSIGYWIGKAYHGKGIGTMVVSDLLEYGFQNLKAHNITAAVFTGNDASRRILIKNHFRFVETKKAAAIKKGKAVDEWIYNITNYEYKA